MRPRGPFLSWSVTHTTKGAGLHDRDARGNVRGPRTSSHLLRLETGGVGYFCETVEENGLERSG
jgi:hypothetical protein